MSPSVHQSYAVALLCFVFCCTYHPRYPRDSIEQSITAVRLEAFCINTDPMGPNGAVKAVIWEDWRGSGVIIDDSRILTAYHVWKCDYAQIVRAILPTGRITYLKLDVADKDNDLAILKIKDDAEPRFRYLRPLMGPPPKRGDMVCAVTSAPSTGWACGIVQKISGNIIQFSAHIVGGNSGSPVYDIGGRLVAITTDKCLCPDDKTWGCGGDIRELTHLNLQ